VSAWLRAWGWGQCGTPAWCSWRSGCDASKGECAGRKGMCRSCHVCRITAIRLAGARTLFHRTRDTAIASAGLGRHATGGRSWWTFDGRRCRLQGDGFIIPLSRQGEEVFCVAHPLCSETPGDSMDSFVAAVWLAARRCVHGGGGLELVGPARRDITSGRRCGGGTVSGAGCQSSSAASRCGPTVHVL
jgi:hypothetical protein